MEFPRGSCGGIRRIKRYSMKKKWILKRIPADYGTLSAKFGLDPVAIRIMVNRGYDTEEKIRKYLYTDESVFDVSDGLPDIDEAVSALKRFKEEGKKVRIIGDYDIDGVCATAILLKAFKAFGMDADYVIPHRITDGYGLNVNLIENAKKDGIEAVVTCDNGIAAAEEIELASQYGIEVVVTDHHEIPEKLPKALAIVDPKREENTYPNPDICGAYVAYKVVAKLLWDGEDGYAALRKELLILAGFATVGDIMPLYEENRALVRYCLSHIKEGANKGLEALIRTTDIMDKKVTAYSIGFVLGPCINATGRLDSADNALKLLMSDDPDEARKLAITLREKNEERKEITVRGQEEAVAKVKEQGLNDNVLVIFLPDVHESIAGIIAGRLKEVYYRPSIVFTNSENSDFVKGSGRSIEAYDMFAKLSECADLFEKFGGHPMAAGITMPKNNLDELRRRLNENAGLSKEDLLPTLTIDADMPFSYATEKLVTDLEKLEPFGVKNEKPVFARKDVLIVDAKVFGKNKDMAMFTVKEPSISGKTFKLKLFRHLVEFHEYLDELHGAGTAEALYRGTPASVKVAFYPDLNEYRNARNIEFVITDFG